MSRRESLQDMNTAETLCQALLEVVAKRVNSSRAARPRSVDFVQDPR